MAKPLEGRNPHPGSLAHPFSLHIKRTAFGKHHETKYTHQTHRDKIATVINGLKVIEEHYFIKKHGTKKKNKRSHIILWKMTHVQIIITAQSLGCLCAMIGNSIRTVFPVLINQSCER